MFEVILIPFGTDIPLNASPNWVDIGLDYRLIGPKPLS